jgi:uncharacterized protein with GYD domain
VSTRGGKTEYKTVGPEYKTVGPYDIVTILEAPDDESVTAVMLELGTGGNLRTTTLRAYDRDDMSGILQRLG